MARTIDGLSRSLADAAAGNLDLLLARSALCSLGDKICVELPQAGHCLDHRSASPGAVHWRHHSCATATRKAGLER
jgi:hypothetical protein